MITVGLLALVMAATPLQLTVSQLVADHVELTGRRVLLRGWLTAPCYKFGCALTAKPNGEGDRVSIGSSAEFDKAVAQSVGRELIIQVTVTDICWPSPPGSAEITICTDRASQVVDPQLVQILP